MPICCCKDCANVYGVRPGIDEALLSHGTAGFLTRPMRTLAPYGEDRVVLDAPIARHGRLSTLNEAGQGSGGKESEEAGSLDVSEDSSERPHPSLLNLVKAAEEIERAQPVAPGTQGTSPDLPTQLLGMPPSDAGPPDEPKHDASASPKAASSGMIPPARCSAPRQPQVASGEAGPSTAVAADQPMPPGAGAADAGQAPDDDFAEEYKVQDMHRLLLSTLRDTKLPLPPGINFDFIDSMIAQRGPGTLTWPTLKKPEERPKYQPLVRGARHEPYATFAIREHVYAFWFSWVDIAPCAGPAKAKKDKANDDLQNASKGQDGGSRQEVQQGPKGVDSGIAAAPPLIAPENRSPKPVALNLSDIARPKFLDSLAKPAAAASCGSGEAGRPGKESGAGGTHTFGASGLTRASAPAIIAHSGAEDLASRRRPRASKPSGATQRRAAAAHADAGTVLGTHPRPTPAGSISAQVTEVRLCPAGLLASGMGCAVTATLFIGT